MILKMILVLLFVCLSLAEGQEYDEIDLTATSGAMIKMLRDMVNQTNADTLNLPANATSIRENIVDTFSCENRTYGYYADVDNDCQVFHVCLPSQSSSGRNMTYRWSFICPNETIFNQQVLVCTRPFDAINCEDSPMFYYVNMEFGKINNDTKAESDDSETNKQTNTNTGMNPATPQPVNNMGPDRRKIQRKKQNNRKKQNIVIENLLSAIKDIKINADETNNEYENIKIEDMNPVVVEGMEKMEAFFNENKEIFTTESPREEERIAMERNFRRGRKIDRGSLKFTTPS